MKKTSVRRGLAWILILVMLLSAVPFGVFAEGAAPQEGTGETPVISVNAGEEKCLCKDRAKCTQEDFNKDCPVCSAEDADLDKCCEGKTPEQLTAEAEAKKAAEEEAAKKAAEEEAAKKTAEEEAAKKTAEEEAAKKAAEDEAAKKAAEEEAAKKAAEEEAAKKAAEEEAAKKAVEEEAAKKAAEEAQEASEKAVRNVQEKINALPAADTITAENRGAVEEALTAIDDAKEELTDEEREKLDFTRYDAAVNALYALDGMPGAGVPAVLAAPYTITFESDGGSEVSKQTTGEDGRLASLPEPTKAGFVFLGWKNGNDNVSKDTVFNADTTLTALWIPITYTYVLEGNGGTIQEQPDHTSCTDKIAYGEALPQVNFKRNGYRLTGWAKNADGTDPVAELKNLTTESGATVTLYAQWTPVRLTLTGEGIQDRVLTIENTNQNDVLPTPTRAGYTFDGWSMANWKQKNADFYVENDYSLTAGWKPISYTVTFNPNGGTLEGDGKPVSTQYDVALSQPNVSKVGYTLAGWAKKSDGSDMVAELKNLAKVDGEEITLYAVWERIKPTVGGNAIHVDITDGELNAILGGDADTLTVKSGAVTDISELLQKLGLDENTAFKAVSVELLRNGDENKKLTELPSTLCFSMDVTGLNRNILQVQRNHNGWAPLPRLSAKPTDGQTEGYYLDGNTLYIYSKLFSTFAAYSAPYTVSFDAGDGEVSPKSATTDADGKLSSLPTPTRTGHTFDGWYVKNADGTETKVVEKVTVFTGNATVYAKWNPWNYTVIFDGNGGKVKNSVETSETVSAKYGSEVTPPEFVKEYYTVSAWARNADGTEKVESPIKDLAASNGERITLYAQWEYAPRTVTFDANGVDNNGKATKGTVTEDGTEKASVTRKTQESPINTLKTVPVPNAQEGYYFEGWYYKDRTGKEQPVEIGKTEFTADTTVYAKWKVFEPVTVTLKCQRGTMTVDGKSVSQGTMQTKWPGVLDGTLPTPARTGYKFQGWYTYAGVKVDENTVFLRDTTIYARWVSAVSRTGNPKTGDQIALEAAVAVLVLAAVGLGAAVIIKKKQNKK